MSETIRFGVAGCGGISNAHLLAMRDTGGVQAMALCDIDEERLNARGDEFGVARRYTDWHDLVDDSEMDAIAVCLPHGLHHPVATAAACNGKHVLTEKPMCSSLAECDDMIRVAKENDVVLMVGQILRRYPCNLTAKAWIREGRIGRVTSVHRRRLSHIPDKLQRHPWAGSPEMSGIWLLYDLGVHEYDTILWLLDTEAESVFAVGNTTDPRLGSPDEIASVMRLGTGAVATMTQSLNVRQGAWDCIVVGTEGSLLITTGQVSLNGETTATPVDGPSVFGAQLEEFVGSIRTGAEPGPSGRNVRPTMALLEAAKISMAEGRPVRPADL